MNDDVAQALSYIFALSVLLIIVAYFAGFTSDVQSVSSAIGGLINIATGRNSQGQFANYPGGANGTLKSTGTAGTIPLAKAA